MNERRPLIPFLDQLGEFRLTISRNGSWRKPWIGTMKHNGLTCSLEQHGATWERVWRARTRKALLRKMGKHVASELHSERWPITLTLVED